MKKCARCGIEKPQEEFVRRTSRPGGLASCLKCERERKNDYAKLYREKNRETIRIRDRLYSKTNPENRRRTNLKRFYGISPETYELMLILQNHQCIICGFQHKASSDRREDKLHVDHCHTKENVRGLLCGNCNKGLGCFRDNVQFLQKAIEYLKKSNKV